MQEGFVQVQDERVLFLDSVGWQVWGRNQFQSVVDLYSKVVADFVLNLLNVVAVGQVGDALLVVVLS